MANARSRTCAEIPVESTSSEGKVGSSVVSMRVRLRSASSMLTNPLARPGVNTAGPRPRTASSDGCRSSR